MTKKKNEQALFVKTELAQQIYRQINKQHCHLELPAVNSNACIFLKSLWLPAKKIIQNKYVLKICFVADRFLRVFDTSQGRFNCIKKIPARDVGWSILDTAFSPDGRTVVYSSWSESSESFI